MRALRGLSIEERVVRNRIRQKMDAERRHAALSVTQFLVLHCRMLTMAEAIAKWGEPE